MDKEESKPQHVPMSPYSTEFDEICKEFINAVIANGNQIFNTGLSNSDMAIQVILWDQVKNTPENPSADKGSSLRYGSNVPVEYSMTILHNLMIQLGGTLQEAPSKEEVQ